MQKSCSNQSGRRELKIARNWSQLKQFPNLKFHGELNMIESSKSALSAMIIELVSLRVDSQFLSVYILN